MVPGVRARNCSQTQAHAARRRHGNRPELSALQETFRRVLAAVPAKEFHLIVFVLRGMMRKRSPGRNAVAAPPATCGTTPTEGPGRIAPPLWRGLTQISTTDVS